jgi:ABC-type transport system substrate-binding protein
MCVDLKRRASNMSGYCNEEMEALLKKAETELDPKIRRAQFKQVLTKVGEDIPFLPIGFVPRFFTIRSYVKGFSTDARGTFRPWGRGLNYTWLDKN